MINRIEDIQEDELRVIGHSEGAVNNPGKKTWLYILASFLGVIVLGAIIWALLIHKGVQEDVPGVFEPENTILVEGTHQENLQPLGNYADTTSRAFTEHIDMIINDIPLDIYIPHNAKASLSIGTPDMFDKGIVLVTQAADIRADNGKINGAFVLAGEPLAWGLSKKGYVAIIDDMITVGVAENSPLFEEATEKGGYFFRQYALVDNGALVENTPKNKAIRKAICDRGGEIFVVVSGSQESFHDFAQALVDLHVDNAVYLVGADSYGYFRDKFDHFVQLFEKRSGGYKYENYIQWTSK